MYNLIMDSPYSPDFYEYLQDGSFMSGVRILKLLFSEIGVPTSILDVGGGDGSWLAAAEKVGEDKCSTLRLLEGNWVSTKSLRSSKIFFLPSDLNEPITQSSKFDLVFCLEVLEHLSPERGLVLIKELTEASDKVLFSAAIPGQGGTHHINEQWQSHWANEFAKYGFFTSDLIRPKIWEDPAIEWWYRQNIFLYERGAQKISSNILDIAHPKLLEKQTKEIESSNDDLSGIYKIFGIQIYIKVIEFCHYIKSKAIRSNPKRGNSI